VAENRCAHLDKVGMNSNGQAGHDRTVVSLPLENQEALLEETARQRLLHCRDRAHTCSTESFVIGHVVTCAGCITDFEEENVIIRERDTVNTFDAVGSQMKRPHRIGCSQSG
jgi:hypothetical protein